jgi:hypothetical protein
MTRAQQLTAEHDRLLDLLITALDGHDPCVCLAALGTAVLTVAATLPDADRGTVLRGWIACLATGTGPSGGCNETTPHTTRH